MKDGPPGGLPNMGSKLPVDDGAGWTDPAAYGLTGLR